MSFQKVWKENWWPTICLKTFLRISNSFLSQQRTLTVSRSSSTMYHMASYQENLTLKMKKMTKLFTTKKMKSQKCTSVLKALSLLGISSDLAEKPNTISKPSRNSFKCLSSAITMLSITLDVNSYSNVKKWLNVSHLPKSSFWKTFSRSILKSQMRLKLTLMLGIRSI